MRKIYLKCLTFIKRQPYWCLGVLITLLLVLIFFWPVFSVDYVADNLVLLIRPALSFSHQWQSLLDAIASGRVHLAGYLVTYWLQLFYTPSLMHWCTLLQILLNICLWIFLLRRLQFRQLAFLPILFLPFLFQLRLYHDPFLIYCGEIQFYFNLFLLSLYFWWQYLKKPRLSLAISCVLSFFIFATIHEAYLFFLPIFLILLFGSGRTKHWRAWVIFGINCLSSLFSLCAAPILQWLLQLPAQSYRYDGITPSFSPVLALKTFFIQISAALPLNHFFGRSGVEALSYYPHLWWQQLPLLLMVLVILSLALFLFHYWAQKQSVRLLVKKQLFFITSLGLAFWLLPALPVALSSKYQDDLIKLFGMKSGLGYLFVYQQYFGVALLLAVIFLLIYHHCQYKKIFLTVVAIIGSSAFYLNSLNSLAVVAQLNKAFGDQVFLVKQSLSSHLWNEVAGSEINFLMQHRDSNYYYVDDNRYLFQSLRQMLTSKFALRGFCSRRHYLGSEAALLQANEQSNFTCEQLTSSALPNYYFAYNALDQYHGYLILAKISDFVAERPIADDFQIFYSTAALNDNWPGALYPVLARDLQVNYQVISSASDSGILKQQQQRIVRDRDHNSFTTHFSDQQILLDTIVPQIIHSQGE